MKKIPFIVGFSVGSIISILIGVPVLIAGTLWTGSMLTLFAIFLLEGEK